MIIYNLTIKVDNNIAEEWIAWLKQEHIPELMNTGLFTGNQVSRLLEQDESEGITYVVQYYCDSMQEYNTYISQYAQQMRDKSFQRFGDKYIAFRTVMETEA